MIELDVAGGPSLSFTPRNVVIAGYTGRDRAVVQHHIEELAEAGIAPPPRTPMFYRMSAGILTVAPAITVPTRHTSGEVEPVLISHGGAWYLGIGSDHTARDLERESVENSKAVCPKPLGRTVWRYDEVKGHLDTITMRGTTGGPHTAAYQDGTLAAVMPLDALVETFRVQTGIDTDDLVLLCGTVPLTAGFVFAQRYEFELVDSVANRTLLLHYDVQVAARAA